MKSTFVRFAFCLTALVAGTQLFAQNHGLLRVSVPFEFTVAGTKMPAGDYAIEESGEAGTLVIHCLTSKQSIMVLSGPDSTPVGKHGPSLTFERHNGMPALTRVLSDSAISRSLPTSR
jgi:hypothetical protein